MLRSVGISNPFFFSLDIILGVWGASCFGFFFFPFGFCSGSKTVACSGYGWGSEAVSTTLVDSWWSLLFFFFFFYFLVRVSSNSASTSPWLVYILSRISVTYSLLIFFISLSINFLGVFLLVYIGDYSPDGIFFWGSLFDRVASSVLIGSGLAPGDSAFYTSSSCSYSSSLWSSSSLAWLIS